MPRKTEKFLFNQHIFDEPDIEDEEIEPPPPPTFSEAELETMRKTTHEKAFADGKQEGIQQETTSREQQIAQTLQKISHDGGLLFAAELERDRLFEKEVLSTTLAIFDKLFPEYTKEQGFKELAGSIKTILRKQEEQSIINIDVHPDMVEGIKEFISKLDLLGQAEKRFEVNAKPELSPQACRIFWKDGGAVRDIDALAEDIRQILKDTLAGTHAKGHYDSDDTPPISGEAIEEIPENPDTNDKEQITENPDE